MLIFADSIRQVLFPAIMAFAASSDLVMMTISNRVMLILIAGFATLATGIGLSPSDIVSHVAAAALVFAVTFGLFARRWIGGGDAKLATVTALWLGFDHLMAYLFYASTFGGILTLVMIGFRAMPLPQTLAEQEWIKRLHRFDGGVPYGIALAAAALLIYPDTDWMKLD
jgi:prepilin peptidase CpaA